MKNLKPYLPVVYALVTDLVLLAWRTVRQVILPNRNRKGNLLSSLFLLFVGITDRLLVFKQGLGNLPLAYGKKYIRQGLLIVAWALFVLASFEWPGTGPIASIVADNSRNSTEKVATRQSTAETAISISVCDFFTAPRRLANCNNTSIAPPLPAIRQKRYLRLRMLRL